MSNSFFCLLTHKISVYTFMEITKEWVNTILILLRDFKYFKLSTLPSRLLEANLHLTLLSVSFSLPSFLSRRMGQSLPSCNACPFCKAFSLSGKRITHKDCANQTHIPQERKTEF